MLTRFIRNAVMAVVVTLLFGTMTGQAFAQEKPPVQPIRVLFVGNSQIFYNDLPRMLERLAESAPADRRRVQAERALAGGASLESHWNKGDGKGTPRAKIAEGGSDFVVIQEIYNGKPDSFTKHARLFHDLIRQHGGKTILFSTASISTQYPKGFQVLHDMHIQVGQELKVPVAAAGQAWRTYWGQEPTVEVRLALYAPDKAHPGQKGSYLYACVLYAAITGQSPVGLTNQVQKPNEDTVSLAEAKRMQDAAWKVHQEMNPKEPVAKP